ncbi:endonuclease/exonuclease/phosphatase family protein [Streptomyces sp. HB2AG]|uniref:endonuclease/exonuclease/phosphatase family protein n=1 Tax=Streptomyces sp. HB2AG TaxID=2983400 RepID=UPI0022AB02E9|nr:endonuclease/exonuclease/phosphatase family protein [Streptomyces sp. HB2AG]MCZ2528108.1 endonuclease/exonuclease/phosphatase family protein [Streptomyces sp. HB2AG]
MTDGAPKTSDPPAPAARIVFWNLYEAALERRRGDDRRWRAQVAAVRALRPTVLLTTEGWHWREKGGALFEDACADFAMPGSLFPARTDCDMAVFRDPSVELLETRELPFAQALWHGRGETLLGLPGWPGPLRFAVAHLDPFSALHRRIEADHLRDLADPQAPPLVLGIDANTVPPGDPEPDWTRTPPHKRAHQTAPGGTGADREPVARLLGPPEEPLLVDAGAHCGDRSPTYGHLGRDGARRRIDLMLVSPPLLPHLADYRVVRALPQEADAPPASDHHPVALTLVPRPGPPDRRSAPDPDRTTDGKEPQPC